MDVKAVNAVNIARQIKKEFQQTGNKAFTSPEQEETTGRSTGGIY